MGNLIQNSNWQQVSATGGPLYFSGTGPVTFDNFWFNGNRTCSVTMANGTASDSYDVPITVRGYSRIRYGYTLRAIEADSIMLCADFLDANGQIMQSYQSAIESYVSCNFQCQTALFDVPCNAESVHLYMRFQGKVTACTFGAPYASYR